MRINETLMLEETAMSGSVNTTVLYCYNNSVCHYSTGMDERTTHVCVDCPLPLHVMVQGTWLLV
jgi:hypothetical protein